MNMKNINKNKLRQLIKEFKVYIYTHTNKQVRTPV